jgi:hypothetical protein
MTTLTGRAWIGHSEFRALTALITPTVEWYAAQTGISPIEFARDSLQIQRLINRVGLRAAVRQLAAEWGVTVERVEQDAEITEEDYERKKEAA